MWCCIALLSGLGVLAPGLSRRWRAWKGAGCAPQVACARRAGTGRARGALLVAMAVLVVSTATADGPRPDRGVMWFESICSSITPSAGMASKPVWLD